MADAFGDAQIRLAQLQPAFGAQPIKPLDRPAKSLAPVGNVIALGWTVATVTRLMSRVRSALVAYASRKLSASRSSSFAAEPLPPMAQVGALVREFVLEKLLAGEVLEIRVMDQRSHMPSSDKP